MKQGQTLQQLVTEIERQSKSKRDFVLDTRTVEVVPENDVKLAFRAGEEYFAMPVTQWGHSQMSTTLGIDKRYYDKMQSSSPELLATNIRHWLHTEPKTRMLRTLDGNVRGILSNGYRPLDYIDMAEHALSKISKMNCQIVSSALTPTRMYLKALSPKLQGEVSVGDVVQMGVSISNSEVGNGSVRIEPLIYRLVCKNGLIREDGKLRKYHIEKRKDEHGEFLRDATRMQMDKAFWMQVSDMMDKILTQEYLDETVLKFQAAKANRIADPLKAIEVTAKQFGFTETTKGGILAHLIEGGDLSQYGLLNAVTRYSQDVDDYELATELERAGGEVLELNKSQWETIAVA